ncbi:hypothetical protein ACWD4L_30405 [Streptomyces sp. NPDC002596]
MRAIRTRGADLVRIRTGVIDRAQYPEVVAALARTHGATRCFAHRRENSTPWKPPRPRALVRGCRSRGVRVRTSRAPNHLTPP